MNPSSLRIRLLFSNGVLPKPQKKSGLKRSWVVLKPEFETICDIVAHITHSFDLHESCPNGITLIMDGFVLPEFESTSILKDKDLISVKRKETRMLITRKVIEEVKTYIEDDIAVKQPIASGIRLLANKEFDREVGAYQSEIDEDEDEAMKSTSPVQIAPNGDLASKKRKASSKLQSPKKKRKLLAIVNTVQKKLLRDCEHVMKPSKKRKQENKSNSSPDIKEKCTDDLKPECDSVSELDNRKDNMQVSSVPDVAKKVSRSTLRKRTKRLLKRLQRDKAKSNEQCDIAQPVKDTTKNTGSKSDEQCDIPQPVKDKTTNTGSKSDEQRDMPHPVSKKDIVANIIQQSDEDSDAEGDLVPVVIRPGLMRFIPSGKVKDVQENLEANALDVPSIQNGTCEDHSVPENGSNVKRNQEAKEAYCWNGITNKRKGQKWGQEMQPTSTWKEPRNDNTHSSSTWTARNQSTSWQESEDINVQSNGTLADKIHHRSYDKSVDFDKLIPLTDLPKVGDVIAYRLLELSSSWCPEVSPFRVGKITSFEPGSNRIMLVPVSEFPLDLNLNKNDDDDEQPLGSSVYNEDGSLETDFSTLNDVRIMMVDNSTQSEGTKIPAAKGISSPSTSKRNDEIQNFKEVASNVSSQELHQSKGTEIPATNVISSPSTSERNNETHKVKEGASNVKEGEVASNVSEANGKKDAWEEIAEAVSAKKAQLMQEDSWSKKETPPKRPWSYRSLRNSAIGPIMARLREQNGA